MWTAGGSFSTTVEKPLLWWNPEWKNKALDSVTDITYRERDTGGTSTPVFSSKNAVIYIGYWR